MELRKTAGIGHTSIQPRRSLPSILHKTMGLPNRQFVIFPRMFVSYMVQKPLVRLHLLLAQRTLFYHYKRPVRPSGISILSSIEIPP